MIYYGMMLCPDCVEATKRIEERGIICEFIDITASTANLKEFLKLRDHREEFDEIRSEGKIGIPCFQMEDDRILFELPENGEKD